MSNEDFKARRTRGLRPPSVQIQAVAMTPEMEFMARNAGRRERVTGPIEGETQGVTSGGNFTHVRPGTIVMYKPIYQGNDQSKPVVGYAPRTNVPVTSIGMNLENGWLAYCPDCGAGQDGTSPHMGRPNECAGRDPVALYQCGVCGKVLRDDQLAGEMRAESDDPNLITFDFPDSTPETRLRLKYSIHAWTFHPNTARLQGLPPIPAPSAVLDSAQSVL